MAMGYSDVMPLSMLQHVQINLEEYRGNGKKSKRSSGEEYEEKLNAGSLRCAGFPVCNFMMHVVQGMRKAKSEHR